jgi:GNAT superfamily N-acetyltransferase
MEVEYRNMRPEDEDVVFDLRKLMWGWPSREHVRQSAYLDPLYLRHTFVALDGDGRLLSSLRYWLRDIRDANGTPRPVGCVASVATVESARRQGHARRLMQMALEVMREEECAWSFLLSSEMGKPLYEGLGYRVQPAPYYQGLLSGGLPESRGGYAVQRLEPPLDPGGETWAEVRNVYAAYNSGRPLSLVRDERYWGGYLGVRVSSILRSRDMVLFVARTGSGQAAGYLLAYYARQGPAGEQVDLDRYFTIAEMGAMPGQDEALPALLSAFVGQVNGVIKGQERVSGAALLPREGRIEEAMRMMFGQTLRLVDDRTMMARPVSEGFGLEDIAATFAAPGAHFWAMDDF